MSAATRSLPLDRRTRHRPIRTEHATIARLRLEPFATALAVIEKSAGVGRHLLHGPMPAFWTGDCRFEDHAGFVPSQRRSATSDQIASTMPNGQAPCRKP